MKEVENVFPCDENSKTYSSVNYICHVAHYICNIQLSNNRKFSPFDIFHTVIK